MRKIKKIAAMLMLGVMLCGSVLTANAACGHANGGTPRLVSTTYSSEGSHTYGTGQICNMTRVTRNYNVYCNDCGAVINSYSTTSIEHSASH